MRVTAAPTRPSRRRSAVRGPRTGPAAVAVVERPSGCWAFPDRRRRRTCRPCDTATWAASSCPRPHSAMSISWTPWLPMSPLPVSQNQCQLYLKRSSLNGRMGAGPRNRSQSTPGGHGTVRLLADRVAALEAEPLARVDLADDAFVQQLMAFICTASCGSASRSGTCGCTCARRAIICMPS